MNLNSLFRDFCRGLKDVEKESKKFSDLKTDRDRFEMAYRLMGPFLSDLNFPKLGKCGIKSGKVREKGNRLYNRKSLWESLISYNESLALAPLGSEESALSFGNRGACLLELDYPKEALQDVRLALSSLPSDSPYREKLQSRKEKCLNRWKTKKSPAPADIGTDPPPPVAEGKSPFFEGASSLVKLEETQTWGRGLSAEEKVEPGQVLIVEKPFSSVLLPERYYSHCSECFARSLVLLPCEFCSSSMYCSRSCLESAKARHHAVECPVLNILAELKARRMELLSLRILLDASAQGADLEKLAKETERCGPTFTERYLSSDHATVYNLVGNTEKRTAADLFRRASVASVLVVLLERFTPFYSGEKETFKILTGGLLLRYMQSLPCNAHEISEFTDKGSVEIGAAVYPTLSLINHSCDPNVVRFSHGDSVVLRAIRPIESGQQILDNYGYHYATHELRERRSSLSSQYYFVCECEPCLGSWPLYPNLPEENPIFKFGKPREYEAATEKFKKCLQEVVQGKYDEEVLRDLCSYLNFLNANVIRPWKPYNKCQEAIKHCLSRKANHFIINNKEKFS